MNTGLVEKLHSRRFGNFCYLYQGTSENEIHAGVVRRVRPSHWLVADWRLCGVGCPLHTAQATVIPRRRARSLVIGPLITNPVFILQP